ncbi:uncharacterized mitochondrial protein AtMg01250-like [Phoenix dactylifera]|uniref:Uncharacterized mitochondrial protein AtMg01250-like n=1 Tax=Phoenix dactylifera TaxID=42345 RepID=A0A8B9A1N4_PHODC|nr:uncharacterized mitochondrial protein AtMg01250-like [Phoenix dactylifera]
MGYVQAPSFVILVNSTLILFFESSIGLRQGYLLSPFLFIICADALSRALRTTSVSQVLEAYRSVPDFVIISHILLVDDCMLLAWATRQSTLEIWRILEEYYIAFGQQINLTKSIIYFSSKIKPRLMTTI